MKQCPIAAKLSGSIGILPSCVSKRPCHTGMNFCPICAAYVSHHTFCMGNLVRFPITANTCITYFTGWRKKRGFLRNHDLWTHCRACFVYPIEVKKKLYRMYSIKLETSGISGANLHRPVEKYALQWTRRSQNNKLTMLLSRNIRDIPGSILVWRHHSESRAIFEKGLLRAGDLGSNRQNDVLLFSFYGCAITMVLQMTAWLEAHAISQLVCTIVGLLGSNPSSAAFLFRFIWLRDLHGLFK